MAQAETRVLVVGAGLAGMATALRLGEMGCRVVLVESADTLGGKAGSRLLGGRWEDHGYHIFFPWYVNLMKMINEEFGAARHFDSFDCYHHLVAGEYPRFRTLKSVVSPRTFYKDLTSGIIPTSDRVLYYALLVDLMSRDFGGRRPDETVDGFLRGRWYATSTARRELARMVLAAAAQRTSNSSAQTWRTAMAAFVRYGEPLYISPNTTLEEALIAPFRRRLERAGVQITTGWRLIGAEAEGDRVARALFETPDGPVTEPVENLVLAMPPQVVARLKGDAVARAGLAVGPLETLCQRPMSALHLNLRRLLPMPREHVALVHSRYSVSLYDLAKARSGYSTSCLNMVIADPGELVNRDLDEVIAEVVPEVRRYLPFVHAEDIVDGLWQSHVDNPLFSNEVGSWAHRPEPVTALRNLFLAGDYVRNHMNVVGMETATLSGLNAAEAVRDRLGLRAEPVRVLRPKSVPGWAAGAARIALSPLAAAAYALSPTRRGKFQTGPPAVGGGVAEGPTDNGVGARGSNTT